MRKSRKKSLEIKQKLFQVGVTALTTNGWTVERIPGFGKSSVRRLTKGETSCVVCIRTAQDTRLGFQRKKDELGRSGQNNWATLCDVDRVVVVTFDDADDPQVVRVYLFDERETQDLRERFDRVYHARIVAKQHLSKTHAIWISLYGEPNPKVPTLVGNGACEHKASIYEMAYKDLIALLNPESQTPSSAEELLTIAEAKRRLALTFGVDPANIKITVEG